MIYNGISPKFYEVPFSCFLPFYEIEKSVKFLQIFFGNHKNVHELFKLPEDYPKMMRLYIVSAILIKKHPKNIHPAGKPEACLGKPRRHSICCVIKGLAY